MAERRSKHNHTIATPQADRCRPTGTCARLQQIVLNLLSNAAKFTPDGGRVHLAVEDAGVDARVTAQDSGRGIEPAFLPHVFERFRQANTSVTRQHGGLGLGLAIVRHLVEAHGGTVGADSARRDQGSTFTVTLPQLAARRAGGPVRRRRPEPWRVRGY